MPRITGAANFSELRTPIAPGIGDAVTSRPPATANFFVDSVDRSRGSAAQAGDFIINKGESLFNGFFNRLTVNEVVLNWGVPNISSYWGNNTISITNLAVGGSTQTLSLTQGFYSVLDCLQEIVTLANAAFAGDAIPILFNLEFALGSIFITADQDFTVNWNSAQPKNLARLLFVPIQLNTVITGATGITPSSPFLLGTRYVDIVSQQLTYNQELKDNTTAAIRRDVLYRWYFAQDNVPLEYEKFPVAYPAIAPAPAVTMLTDTNIPVLQGYTAFVQRRTPPFPKQIRWSPEQPIGQVSFQVYDDQGRIVDVTAPGLTPTAGQEGANLNFQLSMLLSED
jgi:hypothetical protein